MQGFYHLFPPIIANASFQSSGNLYSISPSRSSISNLPVHINAQIIYTRALRIIFPEKPVNPALIRLTVCNQTGCECIVGASNPSLMKGWACTEIGRPFTDQVDRTSYKHLFLRPPREARFKPHYPQDSFYYQQDNFSAHIREFLLQTL